jgi:hypothetical protein
MTDVIHLSTDALVKAINDEYGVILASERSNLQKALAIGQKLKALRPRIAPNHGEWKEKLAEYCPKLSYETATLYARLWDNQAKLTEAAADKSVEPTDLTIEDFRKYLAKPKGNKADKGKPAKAIKAGVEPAMDAKPASLPPDEVVRELEAGELFDILMVVYERDDLVDLTTRLAAHLGMTLLPATRLPIAAPAAPTGAPAGMERRV